MDGVLPDRPRKTRGAVGNPTGRYEPAVRMAIDDGWPAGPEAADEAPPLGTTVQVDASRTVIARNCSPDVPFEQSINPYRGCEHGCIYCFARPSHAFLGLSPGLDFESRLFVKPDAAMLLRRELAAPGYRCQVIAIGTNTDPYQPIERRYRVMREILEVLAASDHPVAITTKSALVTRDIDLLAAMAAKRLALVNVSVTTLERDRARRMEPRAATPATRLETIRALSTAGVPTGVMAAPMIPGLNDHELERILEAAAAAGARRASTILLRLPLEIKELFADWLEAHYPERARRVLGLVRDTRGSALYRDRFGERMTGTGAYAELIRRRFRLAAKRLGLDRDDWRLATDRFRPPPAADRQLRLL
ncbi:MAG: PA0069 family radical SAM protein [Kiloniellales bacterium]